jgi:hypothetical protein
VTLAASSETLATGGVIATHTVGNKEHQAVVVAGPDGHIIGSRPDFTLWFPPAANVANRVLGDLFNTGSVPIRVRGIWIIPNMAAVTGAPIDWIVGRTTAAGTGGTAVTPAPMDTAGGAWPAAATARTSPTAATAGTVLFNIYTLNEETNAAFGLLPYTNQLPQLGDRVMEVVLNQNQGLAVRQSATANAVGATGMLMLATYDN